MGLLNGLQNIIIAHTVHLYFSIACGEFSKTNLEYSERDGYIVMLQNDKNFEISDKFKFLRKLDYDI